MGRVFNWSAVMLMSIFPKQIYFKCLVNARNIVLTSFNFFVWVEEFLSGMTPLEHYVVM